MWFEQETQNVGNKEITSQDHGLQLWVPRGNPNAQNSPTKETSQGAKSTHGSEVLLPWSWRHISVPMCMEKSGQVKTLIEHLSLKELITLKGQLKLPNTEVLTGKLRNHLLPSGNIRSYLLKKTKKLHSFGSLSSSFKCFYLSTYM